MQNPHGIVLNKATISNASLKQTNSVILYLQSWQVLIHVLNENKELGRYCLNKHVSHFSFHLTLHDIQDMAKELWRIALEQVAPAGELRASLTAIKCIVISWMAVIMMFINTQNTQWGLYCVNKLYPCSNHKWLGFTQTKLSCPCFCVYSNWEYVMLQLIVWWCLHRL